MYVDGCNRKFTHECKDTQKWMINDRDIQLAATHRIDHMAARLEAMAAGTMITAMPW